MYLLKSICPNIMVKLSGSQDVEIHILTYMHITCIYIYKPEHFTFYLSVSETTHRSRGIYIYM